MNFKMTPHKLMIGLFAAIMLTVTAATVIAPKQTRSESENRSLQKLPSIVDQRKLKKAENPKELVQSVKWKYIINREGNAFKDDFEKYCADHLIGRETWVKAANGITRLSGKREINGVYTVDDQMIQTFREYDPELIDRSLKAINGFAGTFPDVPMYFMMAPTSQEFFSSKIPQYAGLLSEKAFIDECYRKLDKVTTIDCLSYLSGYSPQYIYYRTDHHWTSLGAFCAYQSAAKNLGYSAYGLSAFNIETASNDFRGTLYSRTLDDSVPPDSMDYYILASGDPEVKMRAVNNSEITEYDSLYVREFLEQKDKYSSFTGSNVPIIEITTNVDNDKSLLIIKDSYAHSLVPFLSKHYSKITMLDMRYINTDVQNFVKVGDYSQVLFMYNVITFSEDENLAKLALTK